MTRLALKSPRYASEDDLHEQVAKALAILLPPPVEWTTVPAGGYELSAAARARLFRLGLRPGWPDIIISATTASSASNSKPAPACCHARALSGHAPAARGWSSDSAICTRGCWRRACASPSADRWTACFPKSTRGVFRLGRQKNEQSSQ